MARAIHENILSDELTVVFIGREHIGCDALLAGFCGQCPDDIIGFKAFNLKDRNMESAQDVLDERHAERDILGRFLTLSLVGWEGFMTESLAKIESNTYISRFFFRDNFIEGVDKPEDSRSV